MLNDEYKLEAPSRTSGKTRFYKGPRQENGTVRFPGDIIKTFPLILSTGKISDGLTVNLPPKSIIWRLFYVTVKPSSNFQPQRSI